MDNKKQYSVVELLLKIIFLLTVRFSFLIVFLLTALYAKLAVTEYIDDSGNKIDGFGRTLDDSHLILGSYLSNWAILDTGVIIIGVIISLALFQGFHKRLEAMVFNIAEVPWYERL